MAKANSTAADTASHTRGDGKGITPSMLDISPESWRRLVMELYARRVMYNIHLIASGSGMEGNEELLPYRFEPEAMAKLSECFAQMFILFDRAGLEVNPAYKAKEDAKFQAFLSASVERLKRKPRAAKAR